MKVGIIMGSQSDMPVMEKAIEILNTLGVNTVVDIVSAHRTPEKMMDFGQTAHQKEIGVIIAGAGGAAHLPGMVAATSPLPVIGVPVKSRNSIDGWDSVLSILQMPAGVPVKSRNSIDGWDSVLSILQMPAGVPVATVALDGAENAGILAAQILAVSDKALQSRIIEYKERLKEKVNRASDKLKS